jgi:arylsulfatase A-like enzyme
VRGRLAGTTRVGTACLILVAALIAGCDETPPAQPADVLLISLDTLRADRLSCYGYPFETSPQLDALAEAGVRFHEVHAPSGNTKPSHMSLFTGFDPLAHDVRPVRLNAPVRPALSADVPTLPELLKRAGYQTASFTDRGGLPPSAGFGRGFEFERAEWEELPKKINAVKRYLKTAKPKLPLFLFFHTYEPHAPYLPPGPHRGKFTDADYKGPFRQRYADLAGSSMSEFWREKGKFLREWPEMDERDVEFISKLYDEEIAWTDQNVGRLLRVWDQARDRANTLLIVLSDHGEAFHEHDRLGHQRSLYAELMRVPLLISGPGLAPNTVVEQPVSLTGVLPTILELLGLESLETQVMGFAELARGGALESEPIYSQMGNRGLELFESVIVDDLRLLRSSDGETVKLELFDWASDKAEQHDLADKRAADVERLLGLLDERNREAGELRKRFPPGTEKALTLEEEREIEGLGYTGED